ncbi:MAG: vitamin K epoxide reductase family protein [Armatimonadota bacterium]
MQNKAFNGFILALSIIGILIAGYLWKLHATPELIPCGRSGGCATVALSPYSRFPVGTGLPIAAWGTAGYIGLLILSIFRMLPLPMTATRLAQTLQGVGLFGGMGASLILMYIQAVVVRAFCKWCLASEVVMAFMLIVYIVDWRAKRQSGGQTVPPTI